MIHYSGGIMAMGALPFVYFIILVVVVAGLWEGV